MDVHQLLECLFIFLIPLARYALALSIPMASGTDGLLVLALESKLLSNVTNWAKTNNIKEYVRPSSIEVNEWTALGDSFTAGIGSNGAIDEITGGKCLRYRQSYPEQMQEQSRWGYPATRSLNFGACSGDLLQDVVDKQLTDTADDQYNYFGKPELVVMSASGNDLFFGKIVIDCILRPWLLHGDCNEVLEKAEQKLASADFLTDIDNMLMKVVEKGRKNGGGSPPEAFQVFLLGYVPFFDEEDPACDTLCWPMLSEDCRGWFLTRDLRKRINTLVRILNRELQRAAWRLGSYGVIYVDGIADAYPGHLFCDTKADYQNAPDYPISDNTWFWHFESPWEAGEGPHYDPDNHKPAATQAGNLTATGMQLLTSLIPDPSQRDAVVHGADPAQFSDAFKSLDNFENALGSIGTSWHVSWKRVFHPKGTAYRHHADTVIDAILKNRGSNEVAAQPSQQQTSEAPQPTPTPTPKPPTDDHCGVWWKLAFDYFEVYGKNFDHEKLGDGGLNLLADLRHCGVVTDWQFNGDLKNDPNGMQWFASGKLPIGTKSCAGSAVLKAGGSSADGCVGAG